MAAAAATAVVADGSTAGTTGLPVSNGMPLGSAEPAGPPAGALTPGEDTLSTSPTVIGSSTSTDQAVALLGQKMDQLIDIMNGLTTLIATNMMASNITLPQMPLTYSPPGYTLPQMPSASGVFSVVGTVSSSSHLSFGGATAPIQSLDSTLRQVPVVSARTAHPTKNESDSTHYTTGFVSTSDDDPNYEDNRQTEEIKECKRINIEQFSSTDDDQDFVIWINQFEEAVKMQLNPHSKERHWKQCLKWLPLSLASDAYAIWQRANSRNDNWLSLRAELEESFEDAEWKSDMKAYIWDEIQPLCVYRAKVERYVDTFDKELISDPDGRSQYYTRFVNGLPEDYAEFVNLSIPAKCLDINKALEACLRFQSAKKRKTTTESAFGFCL